MHEYKISNKENIKTDEEVVRRLLSLKNNDALSSQYNLLFNKEIVEKYKNDVFRTCLKMIKREDAEEATSDVFFIVHNTLPKWESRASLRTWISAIAVKISLMYVRSNTTLKRDNLGKNLTFSDLNPVKVNYINDISVEVKDEPNNKLSEYVSELFNNESFLKKVIPINPVRNSFVKHMINESEDRMTSAESGQLTQARDLIYYYFFEKVLNVKKEDIAPRVRLK